jgi:dienelactone hydrolase
MPALAATVTLFAVTATATAQSADVKKPTPAERRAQFLESLHEGNGEFEAKVVKTETIVEGVLREKVTFPSAYESIHPEPNDTVVSYLYRTEKPEKACIIALSGWRGEPLTALMAQAIAKQTGIQVLTIQLPFQEERTPRGKYSGQVTLSADLAQNEAGFRQLVADVHRGAHWLVTERGIPKDRLGLIGTSLGGFATGCLYGMTDRFKAAVVQLGGADVAKVVFGRNMLLAQIRSELAAKGVTEDQAREEMWLLAPSTWAKKGKKDGLLILAAEKDSIVTLDNAKALAEAYGDAEMIVMKGATHFALQGIRDAAPKVMEHFRKHLLPKEEVEEGAAPQEKDSK